MRIGISVELANEKQPTGIGLHVRNLLDALAALDKQNEYLLYYPSGLFHQRRGLLNVPKQPNFQERPVRFPESWLWNRPTLWWGYWLPRAARADRVDVFHGPNHFLAEKAGKSSVVTIHDLAYFKKDVYTPEIAAAMRYWTTRALERADRIIALSENTRRDVEELGVPTERVRVIYGGGHVVPEAQIRHDRRDELRQALRLPEKYVLFVGTLQPRKNVPFLLRAFARLKQQHALPHGLVLAGHRDTAAQEIDALTKELDLGDQVVITGYVEDWQLPLLYRLADVFVLPTLYEGFTLVTLEAMAYGTPAIATDTSSIREGVGDAALLVPVNDVEALATAMASALTDPELRSRLIVQGKVQAQKFTWERCAEETLSLYRELCLQAAAP